ncbi:MAG: SMI1/KNR4 family protein [Solobacterium sp.]|nr:SMI1/KNR4 family protein [Solobacterium sp.]
MNDILKTIVENLKKQGTLRFKNSVTEEQIKAFEKEKEILLPEEYKEYLQFSDGGHLFLPAGVQFYGVTEKPVIDVNEKYILKNDDTEEIYYAIGALASGDPIIFKEGSNEIAIYNLEAGTIEEDEKYPNFYDFLNDLYDLLGIEE